MSEKSFIKKFHNLVTENPFEIRFVDFNNLRIRGDAQYIKVLHLNGIFAFSFEIDSHQIGIKSDDIRDCFTDNIINILTVDGMERLLIKEFLEQGKGYDE